MMGRIKQAASDLARGFFLFDSWAFLGWHDIRLRYRRSILGPFWLTISSGVLVAGLGYMWSGLFNMSLETYVPYLAAGIITWNYISSTLTESCDLFMVFERDVKGARIPISSYVLRLLWRNLIIYAHNFIVILLALMVFGGSNLEALFWVPVGILVMSFVLFWMALLISMLSARFRDIPQIILNLLMLIFFMTPVMWHTKLVEDRQWIIEYNPFYYMLELVRGPLLGSTTELSAWPIIVMLVVLIVPTAFLLFSRFRSRIVYWL